MAGSAVATSVRSKLQVTHQFGASVYLRGLVAGVRGMN